MAVVLLFAAPAQARAGAPDDPLESLNRGLYAIHRGFDYVIFGPAARAYQAVLPAPVRKALRNVINNLREPSIAFNDLLQAHPNRAAKTSARFLINSSVGVGGLMDVAYNAGLPHHDNGFGATAGRYGIQPGPYLFIPFIGPTSFRDVLGQAADIVTDPLGWQPFRDGQVIYARAIVDGLDQRAEADAQLKSIDDMSTDPYASLRSLYEQNRAGQIQDAISGRTGASEPQLEDFGDPSAPPTSAPPTSAPSTSAPPPSTGAAIDRQVDDLLNRPLRLVSGGDLEPAPGG